MKLFKRPNTANNVGRTNPETESHSEPLGHVHPNYRHWTWFRPHDSEGNPR